MRTQTKSWRLQCIDYLKTTHPTLLSIIEDYVGEAEHEDSGYWKGFTTLEKVDEDFKAFVQAELEDFKETP